MVRYNLDISYRETNYKNKKAIEISVNGQVPGPVLEFTEGDDFEVTVHNQLNMHTSIHWHGLLVPAEEDGVPYLNTPPIAPGDSYTYKFPLIQSGTYWYHAHSHMQEQQGVYGAIVIHPKQETQPKLPEKVLLFSDWTHENPMTVLKHLKKDGDWYSLQKGSVQSWWKVLKAHAFKARIDQSFARMAPMDISDVAYDRFLMNGEEKFYWRDPKPGNSLRLRMINGSASTYFWAEFSGGDMKVVAVDGLDVQPYKTKRLLMGMAETYDVIVTLPESKSYELRATSKDGSGYASAFLGQGSEVIKSPDIPRPNLFTMEAMMDAPDYSMIKANHPTSFSPSNPQKEVILKLTGFMNGYVWSFNNKTLNEDELIRIEKGQTVRFKLINETMMNHPIHLHGHFFRVLNGQGEYSPLKHTVDVPPFGEVTLEFLADKEKDWFFHCHNLYHMMNGMARVIHYEGTQRDSSLLEAEKKSSEMQDDDWYGVGNFAPMSNMMEGHISRFNNRNSFDLNFEYNYRKRYRISPLYLNRPSEYFRFFLGGNFERDDLQKGNMAILGIREVLPLLIDCEVRFDSLGAFRLTLGSELQLTDHLEFGWNYIAQYNIPNNVFSQDYHVDLEYRFTKSFGIIANYDSDYSFGGGINLRF